ncbi:hypothetical protein L7F22_025423 [Adiantum nelumboides]|nr:hypothetical protein [Adiantum nelumboides]
MADNNEEGRINVDNFDFGNEGANDETPMLVNYLITRLHQAMENLALQGEVKQQLQAYGFLPPHHEERAPEKSLGETSKRGLSTHSTEAAEAGLCATLNKKPQKPQSTATKASVHGYKEGSVHDPTVIGAAVVIGSSVMTEDDFPAAEPLNLSALVGTSAAASSIAEGASMGDESSHAAATVTGSSPMAEGAFLAAEPPNVFAVVGASASAGPTVEGAFVGAESSYALAASTVEGEDFEQAAARVRKIQWFLMMQINFDGPDVRDVLGAKFSFHKQIYVERGDKFVEIRAALHSEGSVHDPTVITVATVTGSSVMAEDAFHATKPINLSVLVGTSAAAGPIAEGASVGAESSRAAATVTGSSLCCCAGPIAEGASVGAESSRAAATVTGSSLMADGAFPAAEPPNVFAVVGTFASASPTVEGAIVGAASSYALATSVVEGEDFEQVAVRVQKVVEKGKVCRFFL